MKRFHLSEDLAGDLDSLIDTRLLIQANEVLKGGDICPKRKSWKPQ